MANYVLVNPKTNAEVFLRDLRKSHNLEHTFVSNSDRRYDDVVCGAPVAELLEQLINDGYKISVAVRSFD